MNTLMLVIELFFSIHLLLLLSSGFIKNSYLVNSPTLKLNLARFLLLSCVLSPLAVHCVTAAEKPLILHVVSLDSMQEYASQPIIKAQNIAPVVQANNVFQINYWQLLALCLGIVILARGSKLLGDLRKLHFILSTAIPYRRSGKLLIKVTPHCHIPFSLRVLNKAYIILPVSLLSATQNVKIAIAHEGQHHRNGDCLWAYLIEAIRIIFIGNPGVARWNRVLMELQELSCDEALVGHHKISALDYGHCLFDVVQTVSHYPNSSHRDLACTVGMALGDQHESEFIIRRINMLNKYQGKTNQRKLLGVSFVAVALAAPLCTAYATMGSLATKSKSIDTSAIDPKMQHIAYDEIAAAVKRYHAKSGAIAIVEPSTGKIIAFAEAGDVSGAKSWKSRVFAPASTIKPFVAAAAIDSGLSTESKNYDCHAPYYVDGIAFNNYNTSFASLSVADAIAQSVNVCLIKVAQEMDPVKFRAKLSEFGFDMNSGWQKGSSQELQVAQASLGVSVPVTLEGLSKTYAVLANKGHGPQGPVMSESTANSVTHMLEGVVTSGTGKQAAIKGIAVAGKTGTLVDNNSNAHLALFAGYVPANAPRYAMVVVIDGGSSSNLDSGGALAAPVFQKVAIKSLNKAR